MKSKALVLLASLLAIALSAGSTIAYFTSRDSAENVFTMGKVAISLTEPAWRPEADHFITPGAVYAKDPTVTNTGDTDAYVRIHVTVTDHRAFQAAAESAGAGSYRPVEMLDIDPAWTLTGELEDTESDSVEYLFTYNQVLPAGETAPALFHEITMPDFVNDEMTSAMDGSFDVTVSADAIQADGFDGPTAAFEAFDR